MAATKSVPKLRSFIERNGLLILRCSMGVVFFWFGLLKFFPDSAAEDLAAATILWLSFGQLESQYSLPMLGLLECGIGISLLLKKGLNITVPLLYLQMIGTLLPLLIFPDNTWIAPFMPSLTGQYIIKNITFIASGIVLGAVARGSKLITHPAIAKAAKKKEEERLD